MVIRWMKIIIPFVLILFFFVPYYSTLTTSVSPFKLNVSPSSFDTLFSNVKVDKIGLHIPVSLLAKFIFLFFFITPALSVMSILRSFQDKSPKLINLFIAISAMMITIGNWAIFNFSPNFFIFASTSFYLTPLLALVLCIISFIDKEKYLKKTTLEKRMEQF